MNKVQLYKYDTENNEELVPVDKIEDKEGRLLVYCKSLSDIRFDEETATKYCPLTLLSWDIEVCTESGKFDNNGKNPNNKIICIGMDYGLI
jgi:hypothetical protein